MNLFAARHAAQQARPRGHGFSIVQRKSRCHIKRATPSTASSGTNSGEKAKTEEQAPVAGNNSLITLPVVRKEKVVENESNINQKVLATAAAVCLATQVLTVQGLLLAGYGVAVAAVPVAAVKLAIKKRNAWPALALLSSVLLIPHVSVFRAAYMAVVNPVSVQLKARVTLPALVHAFVGSKHPILRGTLQVAQIVSQVVLVALLLQYLLAPRIADVMRQRAVMLCRAFTTTESQGMKKARDGEEIVDTWMNKQVRSEGDHELNNQFLGSIVRGNPRRHKGAPRSSESEGSLRQIRYNLPEGQQPSIDDIYAHEGAQYAYVNVRKQESGQQAVNMSEWAATDAAINDLLYNPSDEEIAQAKKDLAELGLPLQSDMDDADDQPAAIEAQLSVNEDLGPMIKSINSKEELFAVLNEQLNQVHGLADEVREKSIALRRSEHAREDLMRELKATVGEKHDLSKELSQVSLKFEAIRNMWERHSEQGGSTSDLLREEFLDKVVDALIERNRHSFMNMVEVEAEASQHYDEDVLAAKFRSLSEEASKKEGTAQNNTLPFEKKHGSKSEQNDKEQNAVESDT